MIPWGHADSTRGFQSLKTVRWQTSTRRRDPSSAACSQSWAVSLWMWAASDPVVRYFWRLDVMNRKKLGLSSPNPDLEPDLRIFLNISSSLRPEVCLESHHRKNTPDFILTIQNYKKNSTVCTFTQVFNLSTHLRYLYFTWVFSLCATFYVYFTTFICQLYFCTQNVLRSHKMWSFIIN